MEDTQMFQHSEAGPSQVRSPREIQRHALFQEFEQYPFSDDADFKAGLPTVIAAIRSSKRSASQIDEMIGRAQWFYFTRLKGVCVGWDEYTNWATHHQPTSPRTLSPILSATGVPIPGQDQNPFAALNNIAEARKMMDGGQGQDSDGMSFGMLCKLISEGRAGNVPVQHIPEELNMSPPSLATLAARPKPWETTDPPSHRSSPNPQGTSALPMPPPHTVPTESFVPFASFAPHPSMTVSPNPSSGYMHPSPGAASYPVSYSSSAQSLVFPATASSSGSLSSTQTQELSRSGPNQSPPLFTLPVTLSSGNLGSPDPISPAGLFAGMGGLPQSVWTPGSASSMPTPPVQDPTDDLLGQYLGQTPGSSRSL